MNKILTVEQAVKIAQNSKKKGLSIVLIGGCFDILHAGHIKFLKAAKKQGDILIILLESDENVKRKKGEERPFNPQAARANNLSWIKSVDYVLSLQGVTKDKDYDRLIIRIKPDIVAVTDKDPQIEQRKKQCEKINAKLKIVIKRIDNLSTSNLIKTNTYG